MKKLFPLLMIAAGAVAYGVYKNLKQSNQSEDDKTLVVIDDTPSNDSDLVVVPEQVKSDAAEAAEEVQKELGLFESLRDTDEPYERPSFFHMTEDSFLEPEQIDEPSEIMTILVEDECENETSVESEQIQEIEAEVMTSSDDCLKDLEISDGIDYESEPVFDAAEQIELNGDDSESENCFADAVEDEEYSLDTLTAEDEAMSTELDEGKSESIETLEVLPENPVESNEEDADETKIIDNFDEDKGIEQVEEQSNENDEYASVEDLIDEIAGQIEESSVFDEDELEDSKVEMEPMQSYNTPEVDALMKEIAGQVKAADQSVSEEPEINEPEQVSVEAEPEEETDYLQDIRKITEMYSEKVAQYNIRYPYLSSRFIDDTLKFSHQFNAEYPMGTRVAIEHHANFSTIEDLFVFAQIIRQSGYAVREGAEDKSLIAVREMFVDNNSILHDVFKVANQVYCLSGEYQKFRISKR